MPLTLFDLADDTPKIKGLIYGPPGAGKTTLAGTANTHPAMARVLFASCDKGLLSVQGSGCKGVNVNTIDDLEELFWLLSKGAAEFAEFQTVVLDGASELQTLDLEEISADKVEARKRNDPRASIDSSSIEDYGESNRRLNRLFRWYRDLPRHIIFTAWGKEIYPKHDARKINRQDLQPSAVYPDFTRGVNQRLLGYMDFVWYLCRLEDGTRMLLTQEKNGYMAKTRGVSFPLSLGESVANPNLASIYQLLLDSKDKTT